MRLRYDTGTAFGFVRGDAIVVLPEGATSDLVRALWEAMDAADAAADSVEVIEIIQTLTVALGATLRSMPPFAVAVVSGRRAQVAVRGAVSVTLTAGGERLHVDGDGVSTWSERLVEDVDTVSVQLGIDDAPDLVAGPGQVALAGLPLDEGVVLMSRIVREVGTPTTPTTPSVPSVRADQVLTAVERLAASPAPTARSLPTAPVPVAVASTPDAPSAHAPDVAPQPAAPESMPPGDSEADDEAPGARDARVGGEPTLAHETIVPDVTLAPSFAELTAASFEAGAPHGPGASAPDLAPPVEDGFGHLWESTVLRPVEAAAVRVEPADAAEEASPDALGAPVAGAGPALGAPLVGAAAPGGAPWAPEVPSGVGATLIEDVPQAWAGAQGAVGAPGLGDDLDGSTVFSSIVADLRAQVAGASPDRPPLAAPVPPAPEPLAEPGEKGPSFSAPPAPGTQTILARVCPAAHANPASRDVCGRCGEALVGEARLVTRPALGRLRLSTGQVVELDRPVVLGRRPRTTRAQSNDLPRLVAVLSPEQDISRSHVEIQLEDWHVFVMDLHTTNGTTLLRHGQPPRRLHPGEPTMLASGDVVDVGDGVTFVVEDVL